MEVARAITVETVDTVDTVNIVYTVDMVNTVVMKYNELSFHTCLPCSNVPGVFSY